MAAENGTLRAFRALVRIPDLTRRLRSWGLVGHMPARRDHRRRGWAWACQAAAGALARKANCTEIMPLTGAKEAGAPAFYERAGYDRREKTVLLQRLEGGIQT
ncbi:hypothetical protein [Lawsonibacter hominis]|uniref:N-acetyltransferase domain-containing protein n=1 Tax=Lawsonibacter hominis TaxID=2763053 RepID=A0A8J6JF70_9FIRM|nr:hypothetical protein [Lawsonibacter hominis]MBC5734888.1 hypothetical protein [Lawsonibacter hominis]MBS1383614.1 hypothetical protein [Flavonifractor sp.]MDU2196442.1 hypothetical protein [Clostridiales bacterium]